MKPLQLQYWRAAGFETRAKWGLRKRLFDLERYCALPQPVPRKATLEQAMKGRTHWPSSELLEAVVGDVLVLTTPIREKRPHPPWRAFELVDKRMPGLRLIACVNALVSRAHSRLNEADDSILVRLGKEREREGKRITTLSTFFYDLHRLRDDLRWARLGKWEEHAQILSKFSKTKTVETMLQSPATPRDRCYTHVLELLVDEQRHGRARRKAEPLLEWVARLGNPRYEHLLAHSSGASLLAKTQQRLRDASRLEHKRGKARERVRRYRAKNSRRKSVTLAA